MSSIANYVLERAVGSGACCATSPRTARGSASSCNEIAQRTGRIRAVRGIGYMWGIDVMGTAAHVVSEAFNDGLLICSAGEYTVRLLPPLVATRDELALGLGMLEEVL